jgi:hypothetical protein
VNGEGNRNMELMLLCSSSSWTSSRSLKENGGEGGQEVGENQMLRSLSALAGKNGNYWVQLLLRVRTTMEVGAWCGLGWRRKKEI